MGGLQALLNSARDLGRGLGRTGTNHLKLLWMGVLGVLLILAGTIFPGTEVPDTPSRAPVAAPGISASTLPVSYEEGMAARLANLLSQMKGAGAVAVNITTDSGASQEFAKNIVRESKTVQEKDTSGGIRSTTETKETESLLLSKENGADRPVMVRESRPVIKGVLVIAEGASDSVVKAQLTKAVEASLGIPAYKITVLPQRK